jgi:hypothetical protein
VGERGSNPHDLRHRNLIADEHCRSGDELSHFMRLILSNVTRHENGQYTFIVSRKNTDGRKDEFCRFRLHHADVQEIANLSEAE